MDLRREMSMLDAVNGPLQKRLYPWRTLPWLCYSSGMIILGLTLAPHLEATQMYICTAIVVLVILLMGEMLS